MEKGSAVETRDDPRIGVFLCRCGAGIANVIDLEEVANHAKTLLHVVSVHIHPFLCSLEGSRDILKTIEDNAIDRLVVGACSPRLYQKEFEMLLYAAGLGRDMLEMANLREQCAAIHWKYPTSALIKAKDQIAMAVAKMATMQPARIGAQAIIDERFCDGCGICARVCRSRAIEFMGDRKRREGSKAVVSPDLCNGCGSCVAACPARAIEQFPSSGEHILAQIGAAVQGGHDKDSSAPTIIVFTCQRCSYMAADLAGMKRLDIKPHFRLIRSPCSARVESEWVLRAFSKGADGILIVAGRSERCHFESDSSKTRKRIALLRGILRELGFNEKRLMVSWVNSDEPERFQEEVTRFIDLIVELGPNPLRVPVSVGNGELVFSRTGERNDVPNGPEI